METGASEVSGAIEGFRRDHALGFIQRLAALPVAVSGAQRWLTSERAEESVAQALSDGRLAPAEHAATVAHMARAGFELALAEGRARALAWPQAALVVEGEARTVGIVAREWLAAEVAPKRMRLLRDAASTIPEALDGWLRARDAADAAASGLLRRLAAPRHADAGPEGGVAALAETFLRDTADLMSEALAYCAARAGVAAADGGEALWALTAARYARLFNREGRLRRLGADWNGVGLGRALSTRARAAPAHPGLFPHVHVLVVAAARDVRISLPSADHGLLGEFAAAEAVGRVVGLVHASIALPVALRHAPVASVAHGFGSLGVGLYASPGFLVRMRGLSRREADDVARIAATYWLLDARLTAASVLARGLPRADWLTRAAHLAVRALTLPVVGPLGAWLLTRASPGAALRAKLHGFAIAGALRERYDEDWFRNPRAGEPLRGAAARAGELSVEAFAAEIGAEVARGPALISGLF